MIAAVAIASRIDICMTCAIAEYQGRAIRTISESSIGCSMTMYYANLLRKIKRKNSIKYSKLKH